MRSRFFIGIIVGILTALFIAGCSKEQSGSGSSEVQCPEDMILDIKFPGTIKPSHIVLDNERHKVVLDFDEGIVPDNVDFQFILEDGVTMKEPSGARCVLDLTRTNSFVVSFAGKDYRYLLIANYKDDVQDDVMRDGPVSDMALMYYGGPHRIGKSDWTSGQLRSNVVYEDRNGSEHWLFDSFLFLETSNGNGHYFDSGFVGSSNPDDIGANKNDWQNILDRYFNADSPIVRLDREIGEAMQRVSVPVYRRKLIVFIPVAFYGQKNWGALDGKNMDFAQDRDRADASKWYVDEVIRRFSSLNLSYLALDGIYFVGEQLTDNRSYIPEVSDYVRSKNLNFYWIPYWGADGMGEWKSMKFDTAFLQPNYAFPAQKPDYTSHFRSVMDFASSKGMDLEMEFDEYALYDNRFGDYRADRVRDYLRAFREYNVIGRNKIAYYQSDCMIHALKTSEYTQDKNLYHEICSMIVERQQKRGEK